MHFMTNKITLWQSFVPLAILISLLAFNILEKKSEWFGTYSNQYILLASGFVALLIGFYLKVRSRKILAEVVENLKSVITPILILTLVGALAGSWLVSGIIPAMVYYGLQILSPDIFLPACVVISAIISVATGSSWTTTATVGIALIAIGSAMGISVGMIAGAVISGAYFGDKMSPLSDTTNLAPAMAGTDLFTHIKYMSYTTIPSIVITLIFFSVLSFFITPTGEASVNELLIGIEERFYVSPVLFLVPGVVIGMILLKLKPLLALSSGVVLATIFAFVFQPNVLTSLGDSWVNVVLNFLIFKTSIITSIPELNELFVAKGMWGMHGTIFLILSAMVFGGIMDGIGALSKITFHLLKMSTSIFGLFASTVASCLGLNAIASDQYLAIVIPGKMFRKAYEDRGLAPENLSRTLEDSGTVTSVLVPWNTCGAYQSQVLGVGVGEFFIYAVFNWLSPFVTLFFAYFRIKIKMIGNQSIK
jgi:Na+:H+ antiporter, NhaC family